MTSKDRRLARRQRREQKRIEKKKANIAQYDNYDNVTSLTSLLDAAKKSKKTVSWKASVQRYFMSLLRNLLDTRKKLLKGLNVVMGFIEFTICERGKTRHIRSVHFKERVVQRTLCDNALIPVLSRTLIYDNGASLKGKGIHFALDECKKHLHQYYCKHGTNKGWILQIDYSGYFDSIMHKPVMEMIDKAFKDKRIVELTRQFVDAFGDRSLGIGSQVSQILAISYTNKIDHYMTEMLGLNLCARYNDDCYYMHESKEYLEYCLAVHKTMCDELGIVLNPKKTQIIPLKSFSFLKVRFFLTETGKVIAKPCKKSVTRMRHHLKKWKPQYDTGEMSMDEIRNAYESWRGYIGYCDAHKTTREMDKLFYQIYGVWPTRKRDQKKTEEIINVCLYSKPMGS